MAAVAAIAFIASAAVAGVRGSFGNRLTGDEPEYMLTAISLAEDADLNIADEHAAKRYRSFHQSRLPAQAARKPGPVMISPHDPLLSALLALPVAAGGWLAAKLFMAATAAILAASTLWTAVVRFKAPPAAAAAVTGLFAASAPLAVYGSQIYPEVPAALAVVAGVAAVTGPLGTGGLFALSASVLALPWLGIKYTPVAAVLAALALFRLVRTSRVAAGVQLAGFFLIAALAYAAAHQAWYGGWTVYAAGEHFAEAGEFSVVGKAPNLAARSTRLAGLLIDRRFGLVPWQPAWVLAPAALVALIRRRAGGRHALVLPLAAGWLFAAFAAVTMHGWWWPGRHALVVLPLAVIAISCWAGSSRWVLLAAAAAALAGVWNYVWTAVEGLRGDITWAVRFFDTNNPLYRLYAGVFPDYTERGSSRWVLHAAWVAVLAAATAWAAARRRPPEAPR